MTESTEAGQGARPGLPEPTKHARTIRLADGTIATLSRGDKLHALTLALAGDKIGNVMVWVSGDDLRQLCALPGVERCDNCKFSRTDSFGGTRCHVGAPRVRGRETFFPRVERDGYCGKYRVITLKAPREVAA